MKQKSNINENINILKRNSKIHKSLILNKNINILKRNSKIHNSLISNKNLKSFSIDNSGQKMNKKNFKFRNSLKKKEKLDAFELNDLKYEEAIIYDKRTFMKLYSDYLNREHIILFTFFICNDYNLFHIKLARFIFLMMTDMAMNVFFFSDDSMHRVFLNYGKYNFVQQIPKMLYSIIISQLIEVFLCFLSLTDKYYYNLKKLTDVDKRRQLYKILRCIKIKLAMFYLFTFILFLMYWYIISSFCAVYENTQIIFIKDSISSFAIGLAYPIILYLVNSCLRLCAIRNPKSNLKCIYKLSDIIPFF